MDRRSFLRFSTLGSLALLASPLISFASANTDRRFIFIIQRGAADGLNTVIPYADPAYSRLRRALAIDMTQATQLDSQFALHSSLSEMAKMFTTGQALFVHAVASPYRDRSHFDGQNILETGGIFPYQMKDGWMNRLLTLLPSTQSEAIAFASSIPMALRGTMKVNSYAPSSLPQPPDDLFMHVGRLYADDRQLNNLWMSAMKANNMADDARGKQDPVSLGKLAASFLSKSGGPRIAMIETGGWDTHTAQEGRLSRQLKSLDSLVEAIRDGLGPLWNKTTVMVATEFGRTAAANGTGGTDHGTGSVSMLLGGDLNGGHVISDWPGLNPGSLYEGRDLNPTMNLDALITSLMCERFNLDPDKAREVLFPEAKMGKLIEGLIKT